MGLRRVKDVRGAEDFERGAVRGVPLLREKRNWYENAKSEEQRGKWLAG